MPTRADARHRQWPRHVVSVLALLLACAVAAQAAPGVRGRTGRLELYWHDPLSALPFPHRFVGGKVAAALGTLGVEAVWAAAEADLVTSGRELRVVLLGEDRSPAIRGRGVIGAVHRDPGARTIWILLPNLQRALGLRPGAVPEARDVSVLAHAVARVVVHEIFHLVAPGQPHRPESLMQAHFARDDLLAPIRLEPGLEAAFVAAFREPARTGTRTVASAEPSAPATTRPAAAMP